VIILNILLFLILIRSVLGIKAIDGDKEGFSILEQGKRWEKASRCFLTCVCIACRHLELLVGVILDHA